MTGQRSRRYRHLALQAGALCLPATALAQEAPASPTAAPAEQEADGTTGSEIVVTGQRVRGSAIGEVDPLAVLDRDTIATLGATNLTELLSRVKGLVTSVSGSDPVFLLNGRRLSGFDEIATLPPEAIERVEVLPEREAARFGFPPTVRVTNFITPKHFRALSTQQLAGTSTEGGGATNYTEATTTQIDDGRRTSLSVAYFRQNPVLQSQRGLLPDPDTPFSIGGNVTAANGGSIDPALDAIAGRAVAIAAVPADPAARGLLSAYAAAPTVTDIGRYRSLIPRNDMVRVDGSIASPIGATIDGSLNLKMEAQRTAGFSGLAPVTLDVPAGGVLPFADDVRVNRYLPDSVLRQRGNSLNLHAGGTLQGTVRRWAWNVTGTHDRVRGFAFSENGVPLDALQASVAAGGDPLAPIDPATAQLRTVQQSRTVTQTTGAKGVVNGPLLNLPAGAALVTVSADYARSNSRGSQSGTVDPALMLERTVMGASINADLPIAAADRDVLSFLGQVSANAMIGVSDVSRYGRLTTHAYGLTWTPLSGVQFNASLNETQSPPAIALLSAPTLVVPNTPFFDFTTGTSVPVTSVFGGNPALTPERRRVSTIGAAFKPIRDKEFRVNLDYLTTDIADQTSTPGSATAAFQSVFPDRFVRDTAGRLIAVDLRTVNIAAERERKLRMGVNLWTQIGPAPPPPPKATGVASATAPPPAPPKPRPSIFANLTATYRLEDRIVLAPGLAPLDLLDGATLDGTGGRPRWEVEGNLSGSYGPVNIGMFGRLQGATRIRSDLPASDLRLTGRTWLVLYSSLDIARIVPAPWTRKMSMQLTVENLLDDRIDVRDRTGATPNRFQSAYLDPIGRSIRLGVRKLF